MLGWPGSEALCDDDFSDEEWLRVWLYKRHQKEKMHLKGLRPEMYEECILLYHKVYQGAPPNNKVDVHFAHGFTWQKCKGAKDFEGLVAWAMYAEDVIKMLRQQKTLNRKLEKWRSTNGPCLGSEWKFNAKNMPNYTDNIGTSFDWHTYSGKHQFSGQAKEEFLQKRAFGSMGTFGMSNVSSTTFSPSTADVSAISNMKANATEKLKEKQQCLKAIKIALINQRQREMSRCFEATALGEANMDEHVGTEKDLMEGIFGSPVDGIAHSQAGSSRKPNIDSMCGGCGDKNASQKQAGEDTPDQQKAKKRAEKRADVVEAQGDASKESAEVPLKPEPAMNKDVEDAEKSSKKPIEKDTTIKLSDEDADLLISNVYGEILGHRKKRSNTKEHATPKKKAKVASEPPEPTPGELSWIGDVQEPDETIEDIVAN
ncbi:hypothetical protein L7F22_050473 [Adiantum nelumboides]|nr:hypothetical protein [Adiantum nelumboides]